MSSPYEMLNRDRYERPKVDHYQEGSIEPIDYIQANRMNFCLGNVIKYVTRAGKKDGESKVKDLNKAIDYLNFEINKELGEIV